MQCLRFTIHNEQFFRMSRLRSNTFSKFRNENMHQFIIACQWSSIAIIRFKVDIETIIVIFVQRVYNGICIFSNSSFLLACIAIFPPPELISGRCVGIMLLGSGMLANVTSETTEQDLCSFHLLHKFKIFLFAFCQIGRIVPE